MKSSKSGDNNKICPLCQSEISSNEGITICPVCGMPHHTECWNYNKGCTVYGCKGKVRLDLLPDNDEIIESRPVRTETRTRRETWQAPPPSTRTRLPRYRYDQYYDNDNWDWRRRDKYSNWDGSDVYWTLRMVGTFIWVMLFFFPGCFDVVFKNGFFTPVISIIVIIAIIAAITNAGRRR
jgi:hypothetical protein